MRSIRESFKQFMVRFKFVLPLILLGVLSASPIQADTPNQLEIAYQRLLAATRSDCGGMVCKERIVESVSTIVHLGLDQLESDVRAQVPPSPEREAALEQNRALVESRLARWARALGKFTLELPGELVQGFYQHGTSFVVYTLVTEVVEHAFIPHPALCKVLQGVYLSTVGSVEMFAQVYSQSERLNLGMGRRLAASMRALKQDRASRRELTEIDWDRMESLDSNHFEAIEKSFSNIFEKSLERFEGRPTESGRFWAVHGIADYFSLLSSLIEEGSIESVMERPKDSGGRGLKRTLRHWANDTKNYGGYLQDRGTLGTLMKLLYRLRSSLYVVALTPDREQRMNGFRQLLEFARTEVRPLFDSYQENIGTEPRLKSQLRKDMRQSISKASESLRSKVAELDCQSVFQF